MNQQLALIQCPKCGGLAGPGDYAAPRLTDAERYVLSRVRDHEPLTWMHRRVLWRIAEKGFPVHICALELDRQPPRQYGDLLTADVNRKGVLDVDTVKGCTAGMNANPGTGCYGGCYAANIAKFRGIDFSTSVARTVRSVAQAIEIERAVVAAPRGFFRVGTMGDPCHAWEHTVETIEWLSAFARPVIITKHWTRATDAQLERLIACRAVLNTSVCALDSPAELAHRIREFHRYRSLGGDSVARVVSCDFDRSHPEGARMGVVQDDLFQLRPTLDNPLRIPRSHPLVARGIVRITIAMDLSTERSISLENPSTYIGHCDSCPDVCGVALVGAQALGHYYNPLAPQLSLWAFISCEVANG